MEIVFGIVHFDQRIEVVLNSGHILFYEGVEWRHELLLLREQTEVEQVLQHFAHLKKGNNEGSILMLMIFKRKTYHDQVLSYVWIESMIDDFGCIGSHNGQVDETVVHEVTCDLQHLVVVQRLAETFLEKEKRIKTGLYMGKMVPWRAV